MTLLNRHAIVIKCDDNALLKEIVLWGEAVWWPKKSLMRFERLTEGEVKEGTRYRQLVLLPFAPNWDVEVNGLSKNSITRVFLNGMFSGSETVSFLPTHFGFEVCYDMRYQVRGFLNRFLWRLFFRSLHDRNIEAILHNLKRYLENGAHLKAKA